MRNRRIPSLNCQQLKRSSNLLMPKKLNLITSADLVLKQAGIMYPSDILSPTNKKCLKESINLSNSQLRNTILQ